MAEASTEIQGRPATASLFKARFEAIIRPVPERYLKRSRWLLGWEPSFRPERKNAMPLTDIAVRKARPKDKVYVLSDNCGLGV